MARPGGGVFGNFGIADNNPSPIAERKDDSFGVGYFYVGVSDTLKDLAPILLPLRDEQGVELYYNVAVTPWCQITPDLQVISPFHQRVDTSLLVGLRAKVDFSGNYAFELPMPWKSSAKSETTTKTRPMANFGMRHNDPRIVRCNDKRGRTFNSPTVIRRGILHPGLPPTAGQQF